MPEDGRGVGQDPGHGGVGAGVHVGAAAAVQLVPHARCPRARPPPPGPPARPRAARPRRRRRRSWRRSGGRAHPGSRRPARRSPRARSRRTPSRRRAPGPRRAGPPGCGPTGRPGSPVAPRCRAAVLVAHRATSSGHLHAGRTHVTITANRGGAMSDNRATRHTREADVCVVGAGLAGLTAARRLTQAGQLGRRARGPRPGRRAGVDPDEPRAACRSTWGAASSARTTTACTRWPRRWASPRSRPSSTATTCWPPAGRSAATAATSPGSARWRSSARPRPSPA